MEFIIDDALLVGLIIAVGKLLDVTSFNKKFTPIINIALGLLGGIVYLYPSDVKTGILAGLIIGLTATGTYSGFKNVGQGISK